MSDMTRPAPIADASVWTGREMAKSTRWVRDFPTAALGELDAAVAAVRGLDWRNVTSEAFPLPTLGAWLKDAADELETGVGIVKLRGVPVDRYGLDDLRRMYFGFGSHLGKPMFQNRRGELMRDIQDEGANVGRKYGQIDNAGEAGKPFLSSYARTLTNGQLRFHTDRTDAVGLLCVRQAAAGGVSKLCSSSMVHNEMLKRRPDLAEALYRPVWRSRMGEETDDAAEVYPLPVFGQRDGRFTSHYSLTYIEAAQLVDGARKLEPAQREGIDMLMKLCEELSFEMTLEPGDLQLINSHVTYHGRTPFTDNAAAGRNRLLMRLWLSMPNSRALPEDHAVLWRSVAAGRPRGGIGQVAA